MHWSLELILGRTKGGRSLVSKGFFGVGKWKKYGISKFRNYTFKMYLKAILLIRAKQSDDITKSKVWTSFKVFNFPNKLGLNLLFLNRCWSYIHKWKTKHKIQLIIIRLKVRGFSFFVCIYKFYTNSMCFSIIVLT